MNARQTRRLLVALSCLAALSACGASNQGATETVPGPTAPAAAAPAQPTYDAVPLVSREILFGNPTKVSPELSPDGKRLAYLAPVDGVLNVWVATVGQEDDKPITKDTNRGIRSYFWAQNGKHLLYGQDKGGDENWHVYAVSVDGGEPRDLTPVDGVQARVEAVEPSMPDKILVAMNDRDPRFHDVYEVDITTGKRKKVFTNDIGAISFVADHKLRIRVAQMFTPDGGGMLKVRKTPKGKWTELAKWPAEDVFSTSALGFAADNKTLHVIASMGTNTAELRAIDIASGKSTRIASDDTYDVSGILVHPTNYTIEAVSFTKERTEWKVIDESVTADFASLGELAVGEMTVVSRDHADRSWLVAYMVDNGPVRYYAYDRDSKQGTFLFSHRPELEDVQLTEMKSVSYQARDGMTIHGYLTTPAGVEAKSLPTVVVPHGGPWARDTWGFDPMGQWLANRGYAVLQPNFRGSTGYGKEFVNAADREWGGKMQDDVTDGTKWLIEQGIADPDRICIMGGSYGGYATLMGLVREPELYACGVDIVGVANLLTWMENLPPYWLPMRHIIYQRVGNPETDGEFLKSRSPVYQADKIIAPLMIAQGANDPRVPKVESTQIRDAMLKAGRKVEYIEYPDEGHGFARPENRLDFFAKAEKFLADHLGGRVQP